MKNIVLYPGVFDPLTNGHIDLVRRAASIFDKVIVAVGVSTKKLSLFGIEQRVAMAESSLQGIDNVQVTGYEGLTTDFAFECGANIILRGLRTSGDFDYEFQLDWMNRRLASELETLFIAPSEKVAGISSTLVKEIAKYGGNYQQFVPVAVAQALAEVFA